MLTTTGELEITRIFKFYPFEGVSLQTKSLAITHVVVIVDIVSIFNIIVLRSHVDSSLYAPKLERKRIQSKKNCRQNLKYHGMSWNVMVSSDLMKCHNLQ